MSLFERSTKGVFGFSHEVEWHGSDPFLGLVPAFGLQLEWNPLVPTERIFGLDPKRSDTSKSEESRRAGRALLSLSRAAPLPRLSSSLDLRRRASSFDLRRRPLPPHPRAGAARLAFAAAPAESQPGAPEVSHSTSFSSRPLQRRRPGWHGSALHLGNDSGTTTMASRKYGLPISLSGGVQATADGVAVSSSSFCFLVAAEGAVASLLVVATPGQQQQRAGCGRGSKQRK